MTTTKAPVPRTTTAFLVQAALSFSISVIAVIYAIAHLPGDAWIRGFLLLGMLYVVTSTFTLSKCVRDHQEASAVISRVDQVRLERLLAEYDPFKQHVMP
ncbi:YiaA/YiaB family inner membrane protein [Parafrankia sp. EUN1f]|uniref:YiaA/YiaB family inner membrane protein n=1 Tax=Parafrankia sp. EUN1f TaxID=102897 RepID=UPI00055D7226